MKKPTYREYKEFLRTGRLIKTGDGFYIEAAPDRFKLVQLMLFIVITACALLISYLIPNVADKSGWKAIDYLIMESAVRPIPGIYFIIVGLILVTEFPQRYLLSGFKRVRGDYFKKRGNERSRPSFPDILRAPMFYIRKKEYEDGKHSHYEKYIYCRDGRVYREINYRKRRYLWCAPYFVVFIIYLIITNIFIYHPYSIQGYIEYLEYCIIRPFYLTISASIFFVILSLLPPAVRFAFGKFEEADSGEINREEEYPPGPETSL